MLSNETLGAAFCTPICSIDQPGISYAYGYAEDTDNLTRETRTGGSYAGVTTYYYDSLGQLIRANDPKDTRGGSTGTTWIYEYDRGGNIVKKTYYPYTTGTPAGTEVVYTYGDPKWKDKLTKYNGTSIESDAIGNTLKDENGVRYEWQGGRELKKMTKPDGTVVSFQYDRNGQRVRKIVTKDGVSETTSYIMVGGRIIHITHPDMAFHFFYDGQGRPSVFKYNGGWYSYLYNLQGDVIAILDSNGSFVVEYKYDAWGATLAKTGSMAGTLGVHNPFRYRGYVFDLDTGLYYLKSRYYNPKWGRFINADVVMGKRGALLGHNLFAYCQNNAVMFSDYTGQKRAPFTVATVEPVSPQNDALTVMLSPSAINITVYVDVYGDVEGEFVVSAIEKYWNGEFAIDGQNMTLTCDAILGKSPNGFAIAYETSNAPGITHAACTLEGIAWKSGYSKVYLHRAYDDGSVKSDELLQWSVGHEFGHVLGVADYYTVYPNSDFDSIMNKVWNQVTASDVQMLIRATQTQEWTMWQ